MTNLKTIKEKLRELALSNPSSSMVFDDFLEQTIKDVLGEERKAWLNHERCHSCGKECKLSATSDWCHKCWEEN